VADDNEAIEPLGKPSPRGVAFALLGASVAVLALLAVAQLSGLLSPATGSAISPPRGVRSINNCQIKPGSQCVQADLRFSLRSAALAGADLRQAIMTGIDFTGADMVGANLRQAQMAQVNLSQVDLSNATLRQTNLQGANMTQAILVGVDATGAILTGADFSGADLSGADLTGADTSGATFAGIKSENCKGCPAN
jgi:uncharacterized protein YjbI with pentapeptide repeats